MSNESNKNAKNVWTLVIAFVGVSLLLFSFYALKIGYNISPKNSQDWANFATYYTGIISPIVTTVGLYFIIQTFQLQREQLQEFKTQATENTTSFEKQLEAINKQNEISERNMEKQIYSTLKQSDLNSIISLTPTLLDSINKNIEKIFFDNNIPWPEVPTPIPVKDLGDFLYFTVEFSESIAENTHHIKKVIDNINIFLQFIHQMRGLDNYQKYMFKEIILSQRLRDLRRFTEKLAISMYEVKNEIPHSDSNGKRKIKHENLNRFYEFDKVKFGATLETLQTFLDLTSTGEAENENTTV